MSDTPQVLLTHYLKALRLPTFLREYGKLARQCAYSLPMKERVPNVVGLSTARNMTWRASFHRFREKTGA